MACGVNLWVGRRQLMILAITLAMIIVSMMLTLVAVVVVVAVVLTTTAAAATMSDARRKTDVDNQGKDERGRRPWQH